MRAAFAAAIGDKGELIFRCHGQKLGLALSGADKADRQADDEVGTHPLFADQAQQFKEGGRSIADDEDAGVLRLRRRPHRQQGAGDAEALGTPGDEGIVDETADAESKGFQPCCADSSHGHARIGDDRPAAAQSGQPPGYRRRGNDEIAHIVEVGAGMNGTPDNRPFRR